MYHKKTVVFVNLVLGVTQRPVTDDIVPVPGFPQVVSLLQLPGSRASVTHGMRSSSGKYFPF
jgi:hypothetical protein